LISKKKLIYLVTIRIKKITINNEEAVANNKQEKVNTISTHQYAGYNN